jgi:S1-C subfamily serine protease
MAAWGWVEKATFIGVASAVLLGTSLLAVAAPTGGPSRGPALLEIRKTAEAGDADAQYSMGLLYATGEGVPLEREQARKWMRKAAEQGDPRAQNQLGLLLDPLWFGRRASEQAHEAARWYKRAAQQGYGPAAHNLQAMKDARLVADDVPDPVTLQPASLAPAPAANPPAIARFDGEADLSDPTPAGPDAREIFALNAPAIAEMLGDGNYGSGVLVGTLTGKGGAYTLRRGEGGFDNPVPYGFFSRAKKEAKILEGTQAVVMTNRHVLQGNVQVRVGLGSNANGETLARYVVSGVCLPDDPDLDLALAFVPYGHEGAEHLRTLRPLPPFDDIRPPAKGSPVFALGNPEKLPRTITQGLFNGVRPEGLQFDAPISKGSSGGALLDARGRLLGIIVGFAAAEGSQNLNFAIPYDRIAKFLAGENMSCFLP